MISKFLSLENDKQERIINAAIKEFANKGYENASTNEIVKEAGISKGLIFHYFKNKKQLFLFLYDYCIEVSLKEFYGKIDLNQRDIILRLKEITLIKLDLLSRFPEMLKFIQTAYMEDATEVKNEMETKNDELIKSNYEKIFFDIDISKFKEDIDVKKAINIIIWTMEGFANSELERAKLLNGGEVDYEKAFAEVEVYIEILRQSFYK